jgi:N-acetylglucosaminyl-diphospho-decaprenol L-rhamnosyltransferase
MSARPLVSLIVVTYNSAAKLPEFFAALATTRYTPYELLVVDNASGDGSADYMTEKHPQARLLASHENTGFGRACNRGARAANGDLLVFLNPDVIVTPDWLDILVQHMAEQPDAGIICPQTLYPDEVGQATRGLKLVRAANASDCIPLSQAPSLKPQASGVAETAAVPGAALMVRRAAWEQLGGFDERFFMYWEDTELCWRSWLLGWRVLEDLEAHVVHERGGSGGGARWDAERAKNALRTYLKTMRWRRVAPFAARLLATSLAKLVLRRSPGIPGAWAWNWRHLGETLAHRRELARRRRIDPARLERMAAIHELRGRRERRERRWNMLQCRLRSFLEH